MGTYCGYSGVVITQCLEENGKLLTVDPNNKTNKISKNLFQKCKLNVKKKKKKKKNF